MPAEAGPVTGFVLAGGSSSRMGCDKALLLWDGSTLLERVLRLLSEICSSTYIVGPEAKYSQYGAIVEDVFQHSGPLAGIHAGLTHTATELNVFLSVDTPAVSLRLLQLLLDRAAAERACCVVPEMGGQAHPLIGIYQRGLLANLEAAIVEGRLSAKGIVDQHAVIVGSEELLRAGIAPVEFTNVNLPEDLLALFRL